MSEQPKRVGSRYGPSNRIRIYCTITARQCHYRECVGAPIDSVVDPDPGFVRGGSIEGLSTWIRIYCAITARQCHYKECVGALIDSVEDPDPGFVKGRFRI